MVVHLRKRFNVVIQSVEALCKSTVHLCRRVNGGLMLVLLNFSLHILNLLYILQSFTLYHQSQMNSSWLKTVPLGHRVVYLEQNVPTSSDNKQTSKQTIVKQIERRNNSWLDKQTNLSTDCRPRCMYSLDRTKDAGAVSTVVERLTPGERIRIITIRLPHTISVKHNISQTQYQSNRWKRRKQEKTCLWKVSGFTF